jgi:hypothetical protein
MLKWVNSKVLNTQLKIYAGDSLVMLSISTRKSSFNIRRRYNNYSIEYNVIIALGHVDLDNQLFKRIINPDNKMLRKAQPISSEQAHI